VPEAAATGGSERLSNAYVSNCAADAATNSSHLTWASSTPVTAKSVAYIQDSPPVYNS
jgi:hypothetical protein